MSTSFASRFPIWPTFSRALSGRWQRRCSAPAGDWLLSCAILTTAANPTVAQLHDRMPAILPPDAWPAWLDPTLSEVDLLRSLLQPAADVLLSLAPVSRRLNNVNNEGPELLIPDSHPAPVELGLFGQPERATHFVEVLTG